MTDVDRIVDSLLADTQLSNESVRKSFREDSSKSKIDCLVDRIPAKNSATRIFAQGRGQDGIGIEYV